MAAPKTIIARTTADSGPEPYAVAITAGRHALTADEHQAMGGRDAGPAPFELVLSGLAACTAITLRMYAERKDWPLPDVHLELKYVLDEGHTHIEREIRLTGALDEAQRTRLAEIAERTPVTLALKSGLEIRTRLS
jgi:putative redox protein